jgi:methylated-DNA-[protein]-cysteine S-methyltransferase
VTATATTTCRTIDSPVGPITIAGRDGVVTAIRLPGHDHEPVGWPDWVEDPDAFDDAVVQLREYFAGERTTFDFAMQLEGTEFQRSVWAALQEIPYGETWSYGQLAARLGKPGAARAVGLANGRNPIPIVVPCHRVIGADGTLVGYGGGLGRKQVLLELEQARTVPRLPLNDCGRVV